MKLNALRTCLLPLLILALLTGACDRPCKGVSCNNGECVDDGECVCNSGYEGDNCDVSNNQKFNGSFQMTEICDNSARTPYAVSLTPVSGTPNQFDLGGLHGQTQVLRARVEDDGVAFVVEKQDIDAGLALASISGTISIDGRTVNLSYFVFQGADTLDRCSGSLTK
jgi:hypothetical protein